MISVVVCTSGRKSVYRALDSIYKGNNFANFEVILVIQRTKLHDLSRYKKLRCYYLNYLGLSKARNYALDRAKGNIICFTDDDCIVDKNWLSQINDTFNQHKHIIGLFGRTEPFRPDLHRDKICPCTHSIKTKQIINEPCYHAEHIGYGNNMAFRKSAFLQYGHFKEWLGVNSMGESAEDAEFALRLLINNEKLLILPNIKVHHNRWLSNSEYHKLLLKYYCGEISCYGYFLFQKQGFAKLIVLRSIKGSLSKSMELIRASVYQKQNILKNFSLMISINYKTIKALIISFCFSFLDPLLIRPHKNR